VTFDYDPPFLKYEDIRTKADQFLAKYHPSGSIPVPIEEIVEFQLGWNIVPIPGLRRVVEVEGFLAGDKETLWVDEGVWRDYLARYRFTIAHEVGHFVLHPQAFEYRPTESVIKWREYINAIPEQLHGKMEFQAYCFGGLVLVPKDPLEHHVRSIIRDIQATGLTAKVDEDFLWELVESKVAKIFEVSPDVVYRRINYDQLRHRFAIR
jgi:hypothetical protein